MTSVSPASHPPPPEHPELPQGVAPRRPPSGPAWAPLLALIAAFAAASVAALTLALIGGAFGAGVTDPPPSITILSVVAQDLCFIGAALLFARMAGRVPRPWHFGLQRVLRPGAAVAWVVGGYLAFLLFAFLWLKLIGRTNDEDQIANDLGADDGTLALIGVTFVVTVCAPIAEEFFFRGYTFSTLRRFGLWPAALCTGLLFGLVHVFGSPIAFLLPLAMLGATLCIVRERTGSLYPCMALHCMNNSFAMASNQGWGWQIPVVLIGSAACIVLLVRLLLRLWPYGAAGPAPAAPATLRG